MQAVFKEKQAFSAPFITGFYCLTILVVVAVIGRESLWATGGLAFFPSEQDAFSKTPNRPTRHSLPIESFSF